MHALALAWNPSWLSSSKEITRLCGKLFNFWECPSENGNDKINTSKVLGVFFLGGWVLERIVSSCPTDCRNSVNTHNFLLGASCENLKPLWKADQIGTCNFSIKKEEDLGHELSLQLFKHSYLFTYLAAPHPGRISGGLTLMDWGGPQTFLISPAPTVDAKEQPMPHVRRKIVLCTVASQVRECAQTTNP